MAYQAPLRRYLLPLLLVVSLSQCSTDTLDIDSNTRVSAIRPPPKKQQLPAQDTLAAYPDTNQGIADLNSPNLAGVGRTPAAMASAPLPMIDSDEAMNATGDVVQLGQPPQILGQLNGQGQVLSAQSQSVETASAMPMAVTGEGVNIDAGLGFSGPQVSDSQPVIGLAQEQAVQIAERNTAEPLIDGIGTDNPVALPTMQAEQDPLFAAPQSYPQPSRPQPVPEGQRTAMLTRPIDPLANPTLPPRPAVMPASERSCRIALQKMGVKFQDVTPISNGPTCGIPYPVKVYGFASNIAMRPAINLNCQVTLAFAQWVKNELNPSARYRYWSGIKTIIPLGGYSCRRMNSSARNPWSEHARGNAIDVGKFVLNSGKTIDVRKPGFFSFREKGLLNAVRSDSCKYFHTVLGPGSDPHHKDHFHFDLRARKSGYRHCD